MDNQKNQNTTNSNPFPNTTSMPTPTMPAPKPKLSPMENIKQGWQKVKTSSMVSKASSKFESFPPQQKKLLKIGAIVFVVAVIALILGNIVKSLRFSKPTPTPTPTPITQTPLPTPQGIGTPSVYATDSGVLKIESDAKILESKLGGTDLEESNLKPPDINFYVKFTE